MPINTEKLSLFTVTLPWNRNDSEEGDYSSSFWAVDHNAAVMLLAEEMADHSESGVEEGDTAEREKYIKDKVMFAGPNAAVPVSDCVVNDLLELMAGPTREFDTKSKQDFEQVRAILAPYL